VTASATNTVGLWPANLGGVVGFRRDLPARPVILALALPSVTGGATGAVLLLRTPPRAFGVLAPLLVAAATALFALQGPIVRRLPARGRGAGRPRPVAGLFVFQFGVGVYGGFFGAGIGLMMLAALGIAGLGDLHRMNGLKNLLAVVINGVAAGYFAARGAVLWGDAGLMAVGAMLGGLAGAGVAHRLGRRAVRRVVIGVGAVASASLALRLLS